MDISNPTKPPGQEASNLVDKAADRASDAVRATQNVANTAFDGLAAKIESARDQAAPLVDRVVNQADAVARRGVDAVRDSSSQLRDRAMQASDATAGHIREEPLKAILIAAATGAALMALATLVRRSRNTV